ncbi:tandem-95 repeat protein [Alteromonas sp. IB21]|uniref:Ig-like domain-containing protein n=1 Tax=Alteromonas sp. IB21 TaxID=2779369 RepID=UPI0018E8DA3E|nr:Ig-like domain-containing protein [Alteromonas sp. IB21]MBJ2130619.1 tandem-95 repeat protein [Alteromonas sp. IB21]
MMQVVSRRFSRLGNHYLCAFFTVALFFACGGKVYAGTPTFSSSFSPSTIAPNATSTLTYIIDNASNDTPVSSVNFSNNLPANVILASVVNASDSCGGVLTAAGGGSSISYTLDRLGIGTVCEISVDVTSTVAGTYVNTTGDLTSSGGNSGSTSSNLTVESPEVAFSVSLTPTSILSRGLSRVSFEIDNTANASNIFATTFRTTLPTGVVVSSQPNSASDCGGVLDVSGSTINASNISVVAGASCTISVDITSENVGTYSISPSDLTYYKQGTFVPNTASAGSAALIVEPTFLNATFPASALPGTPVAFTLTLLNSNRNQTITDLNFTSDLNATLSGLAVSQLPGDGFCGAGSTATGSSTLSIAGVSLASGESCTFEVSVLIPANAAAGSYANTTSVISYNLDGSPTTSPAVTSTLNIYNAPTVAMEFLDDTVTLGSDVTTRFTVTNTDTVNNLSAGSLQLEHSAFVSGTVIKTLPAANSCGSGSTFTQIFVNDAFAFAMSGASLAAGASCTFDVVFTLPSSGAPGEYVFTSNAVSGTVDGQQLFGNSASDTLTLNTAPALSIALSSSSVLPDDNVTATFTLNYGNNAAADVTAVGFTADLNGALAGLVSESLPQNDICGTGSSLSGTSTVTFAGGTLAPGDSCSFSVSLKVPSSAPSGTVTLTSSGVSGTVSSNAVVNAAVSQDLLISGLTATKIFLTDPVLPGSTSTLRYTLSNSASAGAASSISFTDNLSSVISGLQSSGPLPVNPCGVSSSISGTSFLIFTGGELQPAESCTFDILVTVPAGASVGTYNSVSSDVSATVDSANTTAGNMSTTLTVETLTVNLSTTASNPTSLNPIPVDVFFSRDVVGLEESDFVISNGSASNLQGSGSSYSVDITPSADGDVTVNLPANSVDDAIDGTVKNPAASALTLTYESTPTIADPSIVISSPSATETATASVTYTVTYSNVTQVNLTASAITLNKTGTADATISVDDGDTTAATVTLSNITGDGTLGISIGENTARNVTKLAGSVGPSNTFSVDNTQPTVAITSSLTGSVFNDSSFTATFTFSEDVTGFTEQDIDAGNANVSNFNALNTTEYTATITPVTDGAVTIDIAGGAAVDSVNNGNIGSAQFAATYDATNPTVAISSSISGSATNNIFTATFTFSEDVAGFVESDISASNASVSSFNAVSNSVYSAVITPSVDGAVTININNSVAQDTAGNNNTAATPFVTTFDTSSPSVVISSSLSGAITNNAFTATFTFSEDVSGFTVGDIVTSNASVSNFNATSAAVYTATITPTSDGTVTVDVAANVAQDTAGNNSTAADQLTTTFDSTSPSVVISSNLTGTNTNAAFTATFTFSEDVSGFTAGDIATSNANVSNFSANSASVYTATITPTSDGTVSVDVPANVAQDTAANNNTAALQLTTNFDGTAPSVVISSNLTGANTNAAFTATFTFSEDVSGFAAGDIATSNANVSNFNATSAAVYTATITPTSDGTVTVDVPASAAQDTAANNNTAALQFTTNFDGTAPSVAITSNLTGTNTNAAFTATFTFSEDVSGFTAGDIATSNASVSNFNATSAAVYTATITPTSDGTVTVDVPANAAQDVAGNNNTVANQLATTFDGTAPSVVISSNLTGTNTNAAFTATFTFSEDVSGFTAGDIATSNASVNNFSANSASVYTATITPTSDGTVTVDVPANAAQDAAGNNSAVANQLTTTFDGTAPSVVISSNLTGTNTNAAFTATFTFSEDVSGFTAGNIAVSNANVSNFSATSASVYTATITPSSDGTVTVDVPANAAQDTAGNNSTAAAQLSASFDSTAPSVAITSNLSGATTNGAFTATFTFSEDVTGFTAADVATNNANVSNFSANSASVYTATITPTSDGTVTVDVPANAAQDAAGNNSTAATQFSTSFDGTAPSVTITSNLSGATTNGAFTATFSFSEDVTGFTAASIAATNAGVSNFTASSASVYTATITPSSDGTVTVNVPANVAQDAAGNNSTAATQFSTSFDGTAPSVTITSNLSGATTNGAFTATFSFSEDVTGFTAASIAATNAGVSNFAASSASVYTATITPSSDGTVTVNVPANVAQDAAGNNSTAATQFSASFDGTAPSVTITSNLSGATTNGAFTATFSFSEDVTGFTAASIAATNAGVSNFAASSASVYTATITPTSDGIVTVDVPANVAQDLAGNNNIAAEQFTIENDGSTPSVTITANTIAEVINSEFTATFTFSEDVTGFEPTDISAINASVSAFRVVSASVYTALISPVNDGEVTINVAADAAEDSAGNGNSAAATFTVNYDAKAPTLISSTPQNNANNVAVSRLTVELRFDETVDIVGGNIQLINVGSDQLVETLSLLGNSVTKVSSSITINFASLLEENQQYRLIVDSDSVIDIAGNAWQGLSGESLIFITANEPPSANNDEATIDEDSEIAIDVLVNDREEEDDLDVASLSIDTAPLNGTAIVNTQTGIVTYAPTANFNGSDSFTYTVADTQGSVSAPTTVAITVNPVNDAPEAVSDSVSTEEEQQLVITILENDADVDESSNLESNIIDPTSIVIEVQPGSGVVTIVDEATAQENSELQVGQVIYIPDVNFFGADTFSYTVKDTLGAVSNTATVTVSVGGVNDAPVANDDSATTIEDELVVIAVTANDTDGEGEIDTQSVTIAQQGQLGNATVDGNTGEITYTPNLNSFGTDTLRYSVKDSEGLMSNLATVTIEILPVNDAPQAADDSFTLSVRSPSILNVTDNDLDPDSAEQPTNKIDIESVTVLSPAEYGEIEVDTQTGSLIYTPFDTASDETDTFTYQVADTEGALSNVATVSVVLQLQSTGVVANDDNAETQEDNAVAVNVLANDGDPTRVLNPASINIVVPATNGMAQAGADGLITYTPNENFFGEDSFTYTVKDTSGDTSNAALVSVSVAPVNDAPTIAGTPRTSIISGNIYQFKPSASDIDSSVLTFSIENKPVWGAFDASTGELTGTPAETDAGLYENILITVSDEEGLSARLSPFSIEVISTASLTPTAFNANVQANEDETVSISAQATDPNNLPLAYEIVQQPQSGVLSGSLPNVTYTPNANYFGTDSFEFTASNGEYTSAPATIAINIESVNDAPIATDDEATVAQGQSVIISALENDSDVEDESITIVQATVSQGTVEVSNDELNYFAPSNFTGVAIINYTVADSERLTASAQVLVTVTASNGGNSTITLSVPEDINVNATGLITRVALGQATATDNFNNTIPVSLQTPPFFTPGKHTVVWQAQKGEEVQQESQLVTVNPMVSIEAAQRAEEGRQATINVFLNGEAPLYPINIPYTVSGTSDINDHNLSSGTLVIESGTSASLTVDTKADAIIEGEETLVVTLQPSLNVGNAQHILTIVEGSVEPELALSAVQSNVQVTTIYPQLGTVDVTLSIANKEIDDIDYIDWSGTSSELTALDVSTSDTVFSFSPSSLNAGLYHVRAEVADKAGLVSVAEIAMMLDLAPPQLSEEDTDGDGVPDSQEGYGDDDGDGIANYLDAVGACNVQPTGTANAPNFFIEGDAGACLRIGNTAASNRANGVVVEESSVPSDEGFTSIGYTIDFVISGLPNKGASYRLVIPQQNVIPSNARYRKYNAAQMSWNEFVINGNNDTIHSAKGEQGVCPAPSSAAWTEGLNAGDWCVRLTISDGGPNDDDGIANGSIADPSRLAIVTSDNTKPIANEDTLSIRTGDNGVLNVLENDTDADGDVLSIVSVNAYLGEVSLENNIIVYVSPDNFSGSDTVVYSISDGKGGVDSTLANVLANVNNVPEAQNDLAETDNETAVTIDVLANDSDADGDMLTISSAQTDTGTVDIVDNQLVFTPQPESIGLATITYRVEDEKGSVDEANVRVTVSAKANEPPQAQNDSASTDENTAVSVNVLANDSDPDGDELSIVSATASDGAVSIQGSNLVFTPSTGFIGTAIVDYTITDGVNEASAVLTVRVIKPVSKSSGGSMSLGLMLMLFMFLLYRMLDGRGCKRVWSNVKK